MEQLVPTCLPRTNMPSPGEMLNSKRRRLKKTTDVDILRRRGLVLSRRNH